MSKRVTIHLCTKDRHAETALLLQSLRTQTYQHFDVIVVDDASGTPVAQCYFVQALLNRLKLEGHRVKQYRIPFSQGVCYARNKAIELDTYGNGYACRLDDDCIIEPDYLERLVKVIDAGYDVASGVIPLMAHPELFRETRFVKPIINEHQLDSEGTIIRNNDDCGYRYTESMVLPTHQFRTNALYKREVQERVRYPDFLSFVGFREEGFFSFKAQIEGYKIGVDTGAVAYHLQCPSGGCRSRTYAQDVQQDDAVFREWTKKQYIQKGDFLMKVKQ